MISSLKPNLTSITKRNYLFNMSIKIRLQETMEVEGMGTKNVMMRNKTIRITKKEKKKDTEDHNPIYLSTLH